MKEQGNKKPKHWLTTQRVETLTDGIFAIAMTLLVLNLHVPTLASDLADQNLPNSLASLWPHFNSYALSFILLGVFWIVHHKQFHSIKRVDELFLWMNIIALMFVALLPFSTSLNAEYGNSQIAAVFFELNLFAAGLVFFLQYFYATSNHRLVDPDLDPQVISVGRKRGLLIPVASLMAIGVSFISPEWSSLTYLVIPILHNAIS